MLPRVVAIETRPDFSLILTFEGGERRRFDMSPYLDYPVFKPLRNPAFFALAKVDYGTATWPGEIDIAPETLYLESIPELDQLGGRDNLRVSDGIA